MFDGYVRFSIRERVAKARRLVPFHASIDSPWRQQLNYTEQGLTIPRFSAFESGLDNAFESGLDNLW